MRFISVSPDGALLASGGMQSRGAKVWNTQTGALIKELATDQEGVTLAFRPGHQELVVATREVYSCWDLQSWSIVRRIPQESGNDFAPHMAFSRDGKILAGTHSRSKIRLHNAATGEVLADLEAPNSGEITGMCFNRDGSQLLASESRDALRVWNLRDIQQQLKQLRLDWKTPP